MLWVLKHGSNDRKYNLHEAKTFGRDNVRLPTYILHQIHVKVNDFLRNYNQV
jgi:hypothetical protein